MSANGVRPRDVRERLKASVVDLAAWSTKRLTGPMEAAGTTGKWWRVPILVYHQVARSGKEFPARVSPEMFEAQMRWLAHAGYRVISLAEFLGTRHDPARRAHAGAVIGTPPQARPGQQDGPGDGHDKGLRPE